ncbi:Spy/CpxP family protein refolding chaperone [Paraburkholderia hayleyella]|uniref:Spy/CpxP family protein refolding chaperone n=1 Tax=Paraburkholderia hayleyella TaxID=2152889 RepID=UPI001291D253|nr:Spy/CpxP family protein refolding chaperone [Paraburkholderia hayleyella]
MKKSLVVLACSLVMSPVFAQSTPAAGSATSATSAAPAAASVAATSAVAATDKTQPQHHRVHIEKRITYLHTQLKITPQQEALWGAFAGVMRSNSETMDKLYQQLRSNANVSALDNMKNYAALTQTNADGTKKLVEAFEPLYSNLSPEQKKLADKTFRQSSPMHHPKHSGRHGGSKKAMPETSPDEAASKP